MTSEISLDKSVSFISKRDGIDKVLKIVRYSAKLLLTTYGSDSDSEWYQKLKSLDSSLGTTRKAFRVGKFLKNVLHVKNLHPDNEHLFLETASACGEGVYYFLDQFIWLVKAGAIHKKWEPPLSRASNYAELVSYAANMTLNLLHVRTLNTQIALLEDAIESRQKDSSWHVLAGTESLNQTAAGTTQELYSADSLDEMRTTLARFLMRRFCLRLMLVQDFADAIIAMNEFSGNRLPGVNNTTVAVCGLISATISAWKNWPG